MPVSEDNHGRHLGCSAILIGQDRIIHHLTAAQIMPCKLLVLSGGERGIRTLDRVSPIHAFQACAFNHSAISPVRLRKDLLALYCLVYQAGR